MLRWAVTWLSLGFILKWIREWREKHGAKVYDFLTTLLSFLLIYVCFAVLHVTTWQAFIIFLFWSFVLIVPRVE